MRIIITGVAGFIGSTLCNFLLDSDYEIIGIDNFLCGYEENLIELRKKKNFLFYNVSIDDPQIYSLIKKNDIVIHLAAISSLASNQEEPAFSYQNNVSSMIYLLEACRIIGIKHFIFSSTSAIYENNNIFPLKEDMLVNPNLIYSLGKKHCEDLIQSFNQIYGLQYTILRFFNVYGPNQDNKRNHLALIPYLLNCIKKKEKPLLHSNGTQKRDYVYIDDIISIFKILINREPINDTINLSSGSIISVQEIVNIINSTNSINNYTLEPIYRDPVLLWANAKKLWVGELIFSKERMIEEVEKFTLGDISKAEQLLGWKTKVSMIDGIRKCLDKLN